MSEITITPMEPGHFGVQVTEGDTTTSHRLAVSEAAAGELRRQLEQIGAESSDLKAKMEEEQRARVQAETLLQSEREKLKEEQNQFDEAPPA